MRRGARADEGTAAAALGVLKDLQLRIEPVEWDLLRKANAISWAYGITSHDAVYVALAERLGFPLITADESLLARMKGHSIVIALKELDFGP